MAPDKDHLTDDDEAADGESLERASATGAPLQEGPSPGADVGRRSYLKLAGSIGVLGGLAASMDPAVAEIQGGPENPDDWRLAFEDTFDSGSLDTSKWDLGFGWGAGPTPAEEVSVSGGQLHMTFSHDAESAIHTKNSYTFEAPAYFECRARPPKRVGILPSFWSFSTEPTYWPEIDVFELFQTDGTASDTDTMHSHVHYTDPADALSDGSAHTSIGTSHPAGVDLTEAMHVYGCKWTADRLDFYLDGNHVGWITDPTAMESLQLGGPHYLLLSNIIGAVGEPDYSEPWDEEMTVDWVRAWEYAPGSGTGDSSDTGDSALPHGITISGGSRSSPVDYSFRVTEQLEKTEANGASIDDDDVLRSGSIASGDVRGGADSYAFSGEITGFSLDGSASVSVDGQDVTGSDLGNADLALPHTLCISGGGASSPATYEFAVSDAIRKTTDCSASMDDSDVIDSNGSVAGSVVGGTDSYRFAGDVTAFALDGSATVVLDGQEVDPSTLGSGDGSSGGSGGGSGGGSTDLTNYVVIDGSVHGVRAHYSFEVTGDVEKDAERGSIQSNDRIDGTTVNGTVYGGVDAYRYSGSVTNFDTDDAVAVAFGTISDS